MGCLGGDQFGGFLGQCVIKVAEDSLNCRLFNDTSRWVLTSHITVFRVNMPFVKCTECGHYVEKGRPCIFSKADKVPDACNKGMLPVGCHQGGVRHSKVRLFWSKARGEPSCSP